MAPNEWKGLCGESAPGSARRCIRVKNHIGQHNNGNGQRWTEYEAWDYIEEWSEDKELPLTWNLNTVTPTPYIGIVDYDEFLAALRGFP